VRGRGEEGRLGERQEMRCSGMVRVDLRGEDKREGRRKWKKGSKEEEDQKDEIIT
jgi:hypothetical protein